MDNITELEKEFVAQLTPFQQITHKIAIKNLESSFSLEKCIGFLEFKQQKEKEEKEIKGKTG
jgi:hypothetical protein